MARDRSTMWADIVAFVPALPLGRVGGKAGLSAINFEPIWPLISAKLRARLTDDYRTLYTRGLSWDVKVH